MTIQDVNVGVSSATAAVEVGVDVTVVIGTIVVVPRLIYVEYPIGVPSIPVGWTVDRGLTNVELIGTVLVSSIGRNVLSTTHVVAVKQSSWNGGSANDSVAVAVVVGAAPDAV
jgi:hypothetical protein